MASRRRAREYALQALYAADIAAIGGPQALAGLWASLLEETETAVEPVGPDELEFAQSLVRGVLDEQEDLDARIEGASVNWRLPRMPSVDRNIRGADGGERA